MHAAIEQSVTQWLSRTNLLRPDDKILLAVSGGADSVAMLHLLVQLKQTDRISAGFAVAHVNHNLRGADSDADEQFVRRLAESHHLPFISRSVHVRPYARQHRQSIETAARHLRIQALVEMARHAGCSAIATAHHADDQAETVLHRLRRGTGFRGLAGIRPAGTLYGMQFIRPMLPLQRTQIEQYLAEHQIPWRHDHTNALLIHTRNRIRHQLLPVLQKQSKNIPDQLNQLAHAGARLLEQTQKQAKEIMAQGQFDSDKKKFAIEQTRLKDLPPWVFYEAIRRVFTELGAGLRNYTQNHFESIRQHTQNKGVRHLFRSDAQKNGVRSHFFDYPDGVRVSVSKGRLCIDRRVGGFLSSKQDRRVGGSHPPLDDRQLIALPIGQTATFGPWQISCTLLHSDKLSLDTISKNTNPCIEYMDADKITGPIRVRPRKPGDRFHPLGAKREKKVARFLQDSGLDPQIRKNAFIIEDTEKILWLAPVRLSNQVRITSPIRHILRICVS